MPARNNKAIRKTQSGGEAPMARRPSRSASSPIRILMLEDNEADAELIRHELRRSSLPNITERVDSEDAFVSALRNFEPHVVLSDHSLAQFDAQSALALLRKIRPTTPLIIVTGLADSERTVACIRAGAEDLIVKNNLGRLAVSITNALALRRPLEALTPRQIEVLRMVAEGHRTREIAKRLKLSIKTVESHRGEVMKRLHIHDVVGLVRYAMRVGFVASSE
jgi:DNA-binding NarL/FixJ family response regulator